MKKIFTAISLVTLLTLTGAGCSSGKSDNKVVESNDNGVTIKITDTTDNAKVLESYVNKTFGEAKVTSFLNDFPSKGSTGAEYAATRAVTQKDVATLENLLKKNGFKVESGLEEDGTYAVGGENKTHLIVFTFEIGKTKVGALLMPIPEDEE